MWSGPTCRQPISGNLLFDRAAFEPSDAELNGSENADGDEATSTKAKGKGKAKAKGKGKRKSALSADIIDIDALDDEDEDEDADEDDMSDFIVDSDEDEEEKDARQQSKKALGKRKAFVVLDSDEEGDEEQVVFGRKKKNPTSGQIKLMPKFLPSTKMQVRVSLSFSYTNVNLDPI